MSRSADRTGFLNATVVTALLSTALAVRLWKLGGKSLWLDEAMTLEFSIRSLGIILADSHRSSPPLYYALMHPWLKLCGTSEIALRLPSVICGTLAVGAAAWLGRLLGSRKLSWLAMGFMAFGPLPVEISQMARGYALFLLTSMCAYGCLLGWERTGKTSWAAGYVAATILSAYTHHYWVFNFLAQQLYLGHGWLKRRIRLLPWAAVNAAIALAYLPWAGILLRHTLAIQRGGFWIREPSAYGLLASVVSSVQAGFRVPAAASFALLVLTLLGAVSVGLETARESSGGKGPRFRIAWRKGGGLLLLWFLFPVALPYLISKVSAPIFLQRCTIAAVPAFHLLLGRGILNLPGRTSRLAAVCVCFAAALASLGVSAQSQWQDWRGLGRYLEVVAGGEDLVAVTPSYNRFPLAYYYARDFVSLDAPPARVFAGGKEALARKARTGGRVWLVSPRRAYSGAAEVGEDFLPVFLPGARLLARLSFGAGMELLLYDVPPRPA